MVYKTKALYMERLNTLELVESPNKYLFRTDFKNEKGRQLSESLRFAKIMHEKCLIKLEPGKEYRCDLEEFGIDVFNKGGWIKHLENENIKGNLKAEKENLDFEKSKVDFELATKMLKEYPYTKWFARIGFVIAIVLAVLEILQWKSK